MPAEPASKNALTRHDRRRLRTRDALVQAALKVMAEKGLEGATINEITDAADVGNGSFYNHFTSKEDIMEAAAFRILNELGDSIDAAIEGIEDPAKATILALRQAFRFSISNPDFGWFVLKNGVSSDLIDQSLEQRVSRDIAAGVEAGRFKVREIEAAVLSLHGVMNAITAAVLRGRRPASAIEEAIVQVLILLGLPEKEAVALTAETQTPP